MEIFGKRVAISDIDTVTSEDVTSRSESDEPSEIDDNGDKDE